MTITKQTVKRYAISSVLTFAVGFAIVFVSEIDTITLESFKSGTFVGILFASVRAGIKAILELLILTFGKKK
jgi:O-antigen/teichoic acid export membrane protein